MTPEDYVTVMRALRALSDAWCDDRPPTTKEGLDQARRAAAVMAKLAAEAGLPIEVAFQR